MVLTSSLTTIRVKRKQKNLLQSWINYLNHGLLSITNQIELIGYLRAGGGHLTLIGTPGEIVDEMEKWMNEGVADGFNLMPPTLPGGLEDFVDLIIPEMQNRGLFRKDYNGETFREMLALY